MQTTTWGDKKREETNSFLLLPASFFYLQNQGGSDTLEPREMFPHSANRLVLPSSLMGP